MLGFPLQLNSEISFYQNGAQNTPLINEGGVGEFFLWCSDLILKKMSFMPYLSMSVSSLSLLKKQNEKGLHFSAVSWGLFPALCNQLKESSCFAVIPAQTLGINAPSFYLL